MSGGKRVDIYDVGTCLAPMKHLRVVIIRQVAAEKARAAWLSAAALRWSRNLIISGSERQNSGVEMSEANRQRHETPQRNIYKHFDWHRAGSCLPAFSCFHGAVSSK